MRKYWAYWFTLTLTATIALVLSACTFKKPAEEIPVEAATREIGLTPAGIPKSFFVDPSGNPKTFMCGAASVGELSELAQDFIPHNMPLMDHCNVEFDIQEHNLIAKVINPSFPNDRTRWKVAMTIPIKKHYYYEKEKDDNGREKNKYIENDSRSHWSARPYMQLDLGGLWIGDRNIDTPAVQWTAVIAVNDIEWDMENGFLGFTVTNATKFYGPDLQLQTRINFKEFKHNPKFEVTPFNDQNYKYMNVLHITGEKVQGVYPILYAAKWDLSKTHDIYLVGFPKEFVSIAEDVVSDWNKTLQEIGAAKAGVTPFVIKKDKELKFGFDLRYTTITWIADQKISHAGASPLGVAMLTADVRNGEALWGGITLWGGIISEYIKSYTANQDIAGNVNLKNLSSFFVKGIGEDFSLSTPKNIASVASVNPLNFNEQIRSQIAAQITESLQSAKNTNKKAKTNLQALPEQVAPLTAKEFGSLASDMISQAHANFGQSQPVNSNAYSQQFLQHAGLGQATELSKQERSNAFDALKQKNKNDIEASGHSLVQCADRTLSDVAVGWRSAMAQSRREPGDVLNSVIKELIIHEYGHFLGLGHQFKENILPEKGTVPDTVYNELKAKAETDQTNMTSVMGYRNPRVEVATEYKDIVPGGQDKLVLRFLYNKEYSIYKTGDADFKFEKVPANGRIPNVPETQGYRIAYFPQCNDEDASYSHDPFCNRFDRGYNAKTIVDGYVGDIKDNLVQTLFAFSDSRGGSAGYRERVLWHRFLDVMGRLRVFYDYMRYAYSAQIEKIQTNPDALYEFSQACTSDTTDNAMLKDLFDTNPKLKDLCQANATVLAEIQKLVSLNASDFTKVDMLATVIPGGMSAGDAERDYSRWLGTWSEMSAMPIKISAMYALATNTPWYLGWWGLTEIPHYDRPNFRFSYSSLYPKEFTQVVTAAAINNMFFSKASIGQSERTKMGSALYALSYFNWLAQQNNDANRFPSVMVQTLNSHTQFNISYAAIVIDAESEGINKKRFTGSVYDMYTNSYTPLAEVYILPDGKIIASGESMFIYPMPWSTLRWISDTKAYIFAYKVDYSKPLVDPISGFSVKNQLQQKNDQLLEACITGIGSTENSRNGLSSFFNKTVEKFEGFRVEKGIATEEDKQKNFLESVSSNFKTYYKEWKKDDSNWIPPNEQTCNESIKGLGLVVSTAAVLSGQWLPETRIYLEQ